MAAVVDFLALLLFIASNALLASAQAVGSLKYVKVFGKLSNNELSCDPGFYVTGIHAKTDNMLRTLGELQGHANCPDCHLPLPVFHANTLFLVMACTGIFCKSSEVEARMRIFDMGSLRTFGAPSSSKCPEGRSSWVTGLDVKAQFHLDGAAVKCNTGSNSTWIGGHGGSNHSASCSPGQRMLSTNRLDFLYAAEGLRGLGKLTVSSFHFISYSQLHVP